MFEFLVLSNLRTASVFEGFLLFLDVLEVANGLL